jgi:hypothetical protein
MEPDCPDDWEETMRMVERPLYLQWRAQRQNTINSVKQIQLESYYTTAAIYKQMD